MTVAVCSPDEIKSGMFSNKIAGLCPKRSTTFGFDCLRVLRLASLTWHQRLCESLSLASHSNWCLQTWQQCNVTCCGPRMFCLHPKGCSSSSLVCYLFVVPSSVVVKWWTKLIKTDIKFLSPTVCPQSFCKTLLIGKWILTLGLWRANLSIKYDLDVMWLFWNLTRLRQQCRNKSIPSNYSFMTEAGVNKKGDGVAILFYYFYPVQTDVLLSSFYSSIGL